MKATYLVWCPELGSTCDDAREIEAYSPTQAATIWAQREDAESADYWIVGGEGTTVIVRDTDEADHEYWVTGEQAIDYFARKPPATPKGGA